MIFCLLQRSARKEGELILQMPRQKTGNQSIKSINRSKKSRLRHR